MRSINKVILIGNLTRDPELRQTPNGQNVVTFGLATNREWVTKDGRKQTSAEFHDLVAWAKLAEICHQYLKKGKLVYVEGYLKTRSWDTPEGVKKFRTEIVVQDMIMLDKRGEMEDYIPESDERHGDDTSASSEPAETQAEQTKEAAEETTSEETPAEEEPKDQPKENTEAPAEEPQPVETPKEEPKEEPKDNPAPAEEKADEKEDEKKGEAKLDIDSDLGL